MAGLKVYLALREKAGGEGEMAEFGLTVYPVRWPVVKILAHTDDYFIQGITISRSTSLETSHLDRHSAW